MDFRALILIFCLSLPAIGAIPKCCVKTTPFVPMYFLKQVDKYDIQSSNGFCDIDAVKLHVKGKRYCASKNVIKILNMIEERRRQKQQKQAQASRTSI
ncbi:C-C motif chemokine 27b [Engraulis encrasicolus]|uniref:C-C motif chemokine 27b n=1 Tax=Engraulis encrasicolus TaxID=184585 RepID=UPI002FD39E4E